MFRSYWQLELYQVIWSHLLIHILSLLWLTHRLTDIKPSQYPRYSALDHGVPSDVVSIHDTMFIRQSLNHRQSADGLKPFPDSKVHGANMGPIWGRKGPGGPHVGPMNFAIWVVVGFHNRGSYLWWHFMLHWKKTPQINPTRSSHSILGYDAIISRKVQEC